MNKEEKIDRLLGYVKEFLMVEGREINPEEIKIEYGVKKEPSQKGYLPPILTHDGTFVITIRGYDKKVGGNKKNKLKNK